MPNAATGEGAPSTKIAEEKEAERKYIEGAEAAAKEQEGATRKRRRRLVQEG